MITLKIDGIDRSKCINCLKCIKVCPSKLYEIGLKENTKKLQNTAYFKNQYNLCIQCGHCIAVCPPEAIIYSEAEQAYNFEGADKIDRLVPYDNLMKILRMRRSIRVFKDELVPKEKIEKILDAMRYAPSASNAQAWRFIVITDREEINYLSQETMQFFKMGKRIMPLRYLIALFLRGEAKRRVLNPKVRIQLQRALTRIKKGEDIVFFKAPCVIIIYSREHISGMAFNDAGVALTQGMLAAQSLGLGTYWVGFAQIRLQRNKKLQKHFKIPQGYKVRGVITVGIPDIKYLRAPPRKPLRVQWMEEK